jgi:hypothetical protein
LNCESENLLYYRIDAFIFAVKLFGSSPNRGLAVDGMGEPLSLCKLKGGGGANSNERDTGLGFSQYSFKVLSCNINLGNTENLKQIIPEKELCGHSPNSYIHVSVSDLYMYIPTIGLPILLQEKGGPIGRKYRSLKDT